MAITLIVPRPEGLCSDPSSFFGDGLSHLNDVSYWRHYVCDEVYLLATFAMDRDGTPMFVSYAGERTVDAFLITDADEETRQLFREHLGRICAVSLFVYDRLGPFVRSGSKYDIDKSPTVVLFPHNPSQEEITNMHGGAYSVIEGTYSGFVAKDVGGTWSITVGGQTYHIEANSGEKPRFAGGVLECLRNKAPILGEGVHMMVYKNDDRKCIVSTHDMPYLVKPHPSRLSAYKRLRTQVSILLRKVDSYLSRGQWRKARHLLAQIRVMECTYDEMQHVVAFKAKFPPQEVPFWTPSSLYAKRFLRAFGVNLEHLTDDEVAEVARKVFDGRLVSRENSRHADPLVLLNHMAQQATAKMLITPVLASSITVCFERVMKAMETYNLDRVHQDRSMLELLLREAHDYGSETLVSAVVGTIDSYMSGGLSVGQRTVLANSCREALRAVRHWQREKLSSVQCVDRQKAEAWSTCLKHYDVENFVEMPGLIEDIMRAA